ncbi:MULTISPECIES: carboxylesterase/lipase family protein [Sphingomonas]|uniref:carboxylesterase/lipase family protein n=1 Tax=Sphingomonas TaxID=13687 RepID=UPI000DEECD09|nr:MULTISPECIES: carboxylesterase family protein [Sphingomonas]
MIDPADSKATPVVATRSGPVRGRLSAGVRTFLGLPYAAPPVGPRRFKLPEPPEPWTEVRDATEAGPCAPHKIRPFPQLDVAALVGHGGLDGGDYLRLNIWAPEDGDRRPVMVWIHGGGFVVGSKDAPVTDGSEFARSGVVCVAINYRMGIDGFLPIPGVPTNLGLRDMLCALAWVRDNIAAFGGDPANVTVFGESAGAMAIANLITSPLATGLFRRAIVESGHGAMVREVSVMQRLVRKLAVKLGVAPTAEGFGTVPADKVWQALEKVGQPFARLDLRDAQGYEPVFGISRFVPVWGDDVLPEKPVDALAHGAGKDIDLLIGTNAAEMNLYFVPTKVRDKAPGLLLRWLLGKSHPRPLAVLRAYGWGRGKRAGHVFTDALTDLVFRWPARRFAAAHQGPTHLYEFDWHSPACDGQLGAAHAVEVPFVFKTTALASGPKGLLGESPPTALADRIHDLWVGFATDGSLPWPEFDEAGRQVHLLAADKTVHEPVMPAAEFLS